MWHQHGIHLAPFAHLLALWTRIFPYILYKFVCVTTIKFLKIWRTHLIFEEKPTHHVLFNETWTSVFWIKKQAHTITVFNEHLTFTNSRSTVPSAAILYLVHPRIFYIYRRLRGINREIGFGFVSCSCRACMRACEAASACEGRVASTLEARLARFAARLLRPGFRLGVFAAIHKGFKETLWSECYTQGF